MAVHELVFVVNPASGDGRGAALARQLAARQPAHRVCVLGGDLASFASAALASGSAMIACGGDGTVAATLDAAYQAQARRPDLPISAVGILPLGTGNDLARACGWSTRTPCTGPAVDQALARLRAASACRLDRWVVSGPGWTRAWYGYWSVGIDALIVSRFHRARSRHPGLIRGRLANRLVYAGLGACACSDPLSRRVGLVGHGLAPIPPWASAVVVASIGSYAGGVRLAGGQRHDDGRAEVVALAHGVALGLVTAGLRRPSCLGSIDGGTLRLARAARMQCDGEPLAAPAGRYRLEHVGEVRVLSAGV
jgi:diacylglycerol kinase family enzyme